MMLKYLTTLVALLVALAVMPASAQEKSSDEIVKALTKKKKIRTRGLRRSTSSSMPDSLRKLRGGTRGLTITERTELAEEVKKGSVPQIDIEILFKYNSAELSAESKSQLVKLGLALTSSGLKASRVIIAGHTDAKGSADYNQQLSERRALSVRKFLVVTFGINATRLIIVGYGKEQLKYPTDPMSAKNRRVQVLNLGS